MKLWQKIYLITMILFVVLLNTGIFLVFDMTYQENLSAEKNRAESEYNMISAGVFRNLQSLDRQQRLNEITIPSVLEIYEKYYSDQKVSLTFWKGKTCIYPEGESSIRKENISDEERRSELLSRKGRRIVQIQSMLYESGGKYYLQYEKKLSELDVVWDQMTKKYIAISVGFSMGLAVVLFFLLRRVMQPIQELTQTVDSMRAGNLSTRVNVRGSDDIAVLGEHFNEMAEKIQSDILLIQKEAQAKQDFVDNFAHELKSPITSIYGFAEYIQKANVPVQEITECMEFIMDESTRLLKLSYTLLDMAKMREKEIEKQNVMVCTLYGAIHKLMEKKGADYGVVLELHGGEEEVFGNEILLQSLLSNLLNNAICACRQGGKVTVEAWKQHGQVYLMVEDNGCGIPEDELDKITEPFYMVDKARDRSEGRTGLGLSLCRQIVSLHGADMFFQSEENRGTKVTIRFP